jgi:hypothetical protein
MTRVVNEAGILTLPLYHGTSSYFWPSIKHHGLGGKNIADEWRLVALLKETLDVLDRVADERIEDELRLRLPILTSVLEQQVSGGGFNWRHGSVYVTCAPGRAVRYATRGFGSELLGLACESVDLLASVRAEDAAALLSRYPEAAAARSAEHRAVLLQLNNIHVDRLRDEDGGDPQPALSLVESFLEIPSAGPPQVTFEVAGIVKPHEISAAEIEVTDWGYGFPRAWTSTQLT